MSSDKSSPSIPVIGFSAISLESRGRESWHLLCEKVQDAYETFGCFEAIYDKISPEQQEETFLAVKQLYDLPLETWKKNFNQNPYLGYAGGYEQAPLYESFGVDDASNLEPVKSFEKLMWPNGNDPFSTIVNSMVKQLEGLHSLIGTIILDAYGLGSKYDTIMPCNTLLRIMRYSAPPNGEYMNGLNGHTDKPLAALLCETHPGLEIETKDGQWIKLSPSHPSSFIFVVGDPLMIWSNGRMHAAKHRVMMEGHKERYSMAVFPMPIEGTIIKPAKEFVDEEHPQILKEFDYMDFLRFSLTNEGMAIESSRLVFAFAGTGDKVKV